MSVACFSESQNDSLCTGEKSYICKCVQDALGRVISLGSTLAFIWPAMTQKAQPEKLYTAFLKFGFYFFVFILGLGLG